MYSGYVYWFLYDNGLRHKRVKFCFLRSKLSGKLTNLTSYLVNVI